MLIISFLFLFLIPISSADTNVPTTDQTQDTSPFDELFSGKPSYAGLNYPVTNYIWDPTGFMGEFNIMYQGGISMYFLAVTIVRFGVFFLKLGYQPSGFLDPIETIANFIGSTDFFKVVLPAFMLVWGYILVNDFRKGNMSQILRRVVLLGIAILAIASYRVFGSEYLIDLNKGISAAQETLAGLIVNVENSDYQTASSTELSSERDGVYEDIWKKLVLNPFEMGEFGQTDMKVSDYPVSVVQDSGKTPEQFQADVIKEIQNRMRTKGGFWNHLVGNKTDLDVSWVNGNTRWSEILLQFPPQSAPRNSLRDYLYDGGVYPQATEAFNGTSRAFLGLMTLFASLGSAPFLFVMGGMLIFAHLTLLLGLFVGPVVLALWVLPWSFSQTLLRYWGKVIILGSLAVKFGVSLYVAVCFLLLTYIYPVGSGSSYGSVNAALFVYPLLLIVMMWLFFKLRKYLRDRNAGADGQESGREVERKAEEENEEKTRSRKVNPDRNKERESGSSNSRNPDRKQGEFGERSRTKSDRSSGETRVPAGSGKGSGVAAAAAARSEKIRKGTSKVIRAFSFRSKPVATNTQLLSVNQDRLKQLNRNIRLSSPKLNGTSQIRASRSPSKTGSAEIATKKVGQSPDRKSIAQRSSTSARPNARDSSSNSTKPIAQGTARRPALRQDVTRAFQEVNRKVDEAAASIIRDAQEQVPESPEQDTSVQSQGATNTHEIGQPLQAPEEMPHQPEVGERTIAGQRTATSVGSEQDRAVHHTPKIETEKQQSPAEPHTPVLAKSQESGTHNQVSSFQHPPRLDPDRERSSNGESPLHFPSDAKADEPQSPRGPEQVKNEATGRTDGSTSPSPSTHKVSPDSRSEQGNMTDNSKRQQQKSEAMPSPSVKKTANRRTPGASEPVNPDRSSQQMRMQNNKSEQQSEDRTQSNEAPILRKIRSEVRKEPK